MRSRFCIAPLDVLKIRLQLQIHSLSDPLNAVRKARYGTAATFKNILRDEGVTVNDSQIYMVFSQTSSQGVGILEGKH